MDKIKYSIKFGELDEVEFIPSKLLAESMFNTDKTSTIVGGNNFMKKIESNEDLLCMILEKIGIQTYSTDGSKRAFQDVITEIQERYMALSTFEREVLIYSLLGAIDFSRMYKVDK
jgi:hypothetical protein